MTEELFIESIEAIKKQMDHDKKCVECFRQILPHDYISGYDNSYLLNQFFKILKDIFLDKYSWIEYFVFDLDFGKKYSNECVKYADGSIIDISDIKKLYKFLLKEKTRNKENASIQN